ncbi:unnamed protein product [Bemisia tabaci]|uniref:Uncharacterized protein n=1 Tax=Bemisia tabaci TaxID=7038 RepID=A0A9P0ABW4_BEMTA|nr:PREDICTED: uncharacterized protein LOC109038146 [Bemisia tabaci]XP_018908651.1 PREDICTED: uncharacterized protein LOC109038146 [Bemisia tabaci]XP_018908652.1 PREDICTED: uncharacterized protein LOC109038146 [Bemisia tabaci]XP_018908653.1 PREDICTED: uncharacterized protein LOC109038146 [Bemisia tabaci]XP_018908654.1 PREDICTED: uncharacterized protein LOC109038146 [Bemisia tabaci]CAH0391021.1 unnamed protein product [Bemisia tabaci]
MPPVKQVNSLYSCCLRSVIQQLNLIYEKKSNRKQFHKKFFKLTRSILLNDLHGGIRQDLLKLAVDLYRNDIWRILSFIKLLGDMSIRKLVPCHKDDQLLLYQWTKLVSCLKSSDITGLEELVLKVKNNGELFQRPKFEHSFPLLYKTLQAGLSKSLHTLVLRSTCNNQVLSILGKESIQLTHLDISNSWLVDDLGIRNLLLRVPNNIDLPHDIEVSENVPFEELNKIRETDLNKCCSTLTEVKIQDTNTSSVSVIMLLYFIKTLKSVGGFIYYRNVGDAILTIKCEKKSLKLNLTELFDTQLPHDKLLSLSETLPSLTTLYTRASFLPTELRPFPLLAALIVDFDFDLHKQVFFPFLKNNGRHLRKLTLIDQPFDVDLILIATYCPELRELVAKVAVSEEHSPVTMLELQNVNLRINSSSTLRWLLKQAPNLTRCKVHIVDDDLSFKRTGIDNEFFWSIVKYSPPAFKALQELHIVIWDPGFLLMTYETAKGLIEACPKLKRLGDLDTWKMNSCDLCKLVKKIQSSNWDLQLMYSQDPPMT